MAGRPGATWVAEHAAFERLRRQAGTGQLDAEGQHVHLVVDEVDDLRRLVVGLHGLVGVVAVARPQGLVRPQVADAEGVRPLVLVVELADEVDVGQRRARDQPLRLVVLLLGLGREEHRQHGVDTEHDAGDVVALELGDHVGGLVGERVDVELVGQTVVRVLAVLGQDLLPRVDALLVPRVLGGDDGVLARLVLQIASGKLGRLAAEAGQNPRRHALGDDRAVGRDAP